MQAAGSEVQRHAPYFSDAERVMCSAKQRRLHVWCCRGQRKMPRHTDERSLCTLPCHHSHHHVNNLLFPLLTSVLFHPPSSNLPFSTLIHSHLPHHRPAYGHPALRWYAAAHIPTSRRRRQCSLADAPSVRCPPIAASPLGLPSCPPLHCRLLRPSHSGHSPPNLVSTLRNRRAGDLQRSVSQSQHVGRDLPWR